MLLKVKTTLYSMCWLCWVRTLMSWPFVSECKRINCSLNQNSGIQEHKQLCSAPCRCRPTRCSRRCTSTADSSVNAFAECGQVSALTFVGGNRTFQGSFKALGTTIEHICSHLSILDWKGSSRGCTRQPTGGIADTLEPKKTWIDYSWQKRVYDKHNIYVFTILP